MGVFKWSIHWSKLHFYWLICWPNLNYFSLLLSVSPPLKLVHYGRQQVVQAIDDIEDPDYANILAYMPPYHLRRLKSRKKNWLVVKVLRKENQQLKHLLLKLWVMQGYGIHYRMLGYMEENLEVIHPVIFMVLWSTNA